MIQAEQTNPFVVGKYVSDTYFCDRNQETAFIIKQIENGRNLALISPRRMGKTGLILHCFSQPKLKENYHTFFVDIYATSSLAEFVYLFGKVVYNELKSKHTKMAESFFQTIKSLSAGFKIDSQTGEPTFSIGLGDIQTPKTTLDEIFDYLESADKPCIVAIDEFQQVGSYAEKNIEALLRTKIQHCKRTSFIFSGSKQHTMSNMFNSSSKPFYQSAITMNLEPIPLNVYADFASQMFQSRNKNIDFESIERVYQEFGGCTWFVQMMMNELFALTPQGGKCNLTFFDTAWHNLIRMQESSYLELLSRMSHRQKQILQAIAKEGIVSSPTSATFISKHKLSSASSVQAALRPLLDRGIVASDKGSYRIYDYFFASYLALEY